MPVEPASDQTLILLLIFCVYWLTSYQATETTLGIFNRESTIQVFDYPGSRRFKKPKGVLSSSNDQKKQEDMTTVNMKFQYIDSWAQELE